MDNKLIDVLRSVGKETASLDAPDGSQLLVLPYGGRILGLYAPGDPRNFLWMNPALQDVESARTFYASEAWKNSGGDRTWLSPEIDFFLPNFPKLDAYHQPRALDPGSFQMKKEAGAIHLTTEFSLTPLRHGSPVALRLTKSVHTTNHPMRHERRLRELEGIQFAGYSLRTTLEIMDPLSNTPSIGLWSLLQMPHGGQMLLPTYGVAEPGVYFGEIPFEDLPIVPSGVRYYTRAKGAQKIGLSAVSCPGRAGYYYRMHGMAHLIVRSFSVNPSGDYVDVPWTKPDDLGYAVQVCNVDTPEFGSFTELEYHVPAIGGDTARSRADDISHVWAFRGNFDQINLIAEKLLGFSL